MSIPNPGSKEAIKTGCTCPVMDNHQGQGFFMYKWQKKPCFWMNNDCPVHKNKEYPDGELSPIGDMRDQ